MNPRSLLLLLFSASGSVSLVSCAMTAATALSLAPALLSHMAVLDDALESIKTTQIVLAAIKLRSLVPEYAIKLSEESSDEEEEKQSRKKDAAAGSDSDEKDGSVSSESDSDSEDISVTTSSSILVNSLNSILKTLPPSSKEEALQQIATFHFDGPQSMEAFVAERESESALKIEESFASISAIRGLLRSAGPSSPPSVILLARLVSKLDSLENEYEELQELENHQLKSSSKQEKKAKAAAKAAKADLKLSESRAKVAKIVLKVAAILDEN